MKHKIKNQKSKINPPDGGQNSKLQIVLLVLLTALAYSNIFQNGFVIDDKSFIGGWEEAKGLGNTPKFFAGNVPPGHEGVYRPVRSVLYAVYYQIFGTNIFWYHLHSILVHLASTVLVYLIVRELITSTTSSTSIIGSKIKKPRDTRGTGDTLDTIPFIAALLFGLHPIHTETITYISSGMDATGMMFMFLSFYLYVHSSLKRPGLAKLASVVFAIFAFFTNETTLVLPLLLILYGFCFKVKSQKSKIKITIQNLKVYSPYLLGVVLFLGTRFFVLHITSRGPYLADSVYLTILTMTKVFVKYITLLIWPVSLANNHTISGGIEAFVYRGYNQDVIKAQTLFDTEILLSVVLIVSLLVLAWKIRKKIPLVTFGIFWFFISLLPVSEIVPQGSMLGERFLYIPSFGFVLILAWFFCNQLRRIGIICLIGLILFLAVLTYQRNKDWHDEITFWKKDINIYPQTNAYAYFQLGNQYKFTEQYNLALENYNKAFKINPHFAVALGNAGLVYESVGDSEKAIKSYQKAIEVDPSFWEGYLKLGAIYEHEGEFKLARDIYLELLKQYPNLSEVQIKIYNLNQKLKQKP